MNNSATAISIFDAKTNLSKYIKLAESGKTIYIGAYGKPQVKLTNLKPECQVKFGVLKNLHYKDDDFVGTDGDIQKMFYGESWDKS
jgi:antitoxin (DNA-binding transcriptional repressor) of toxin-antitoxin stability system